VGALVIMFLKGRFNFQELHSTLMEAGFTTASVFLIVIGSQMFGRMLTVSGLIAELSEFVASLQIHPLLVITGMLIILMVMGAFPFLLMLMATIVLVLFFPGRATWLPSLM
jgi:TRAP-type C4-dicarboxylate transport system permease large subunit